MGVPPFSSRRRRSSRPSTTRCCGCTLRSRCTRPRAGPAAQNTGIADRAPTEQLGTFLLVLYEEVLCESFAPITRRKKFVIMFRFFIPLAQQIKNKLSSFCYPTFFVQEIHTVSFNCEGFGAPPLPRGGSAAAAPQRLSRPGLCPGHAAARGPTHRKVFVTRNRHGCMRDPRSYSPAAPSRRCVGRFPSAPVMPRPAVGPTPAYRVL